MGQGEELDTAIMAVREELECYKRSHEDSAEFAAGYRTALADTLANLRLLRKSMRGLS